MCLGVVETRPGISALLVDQGQFVASAGDALAERRHWDVHTAKALLGLAQTAGRLTIGVGAAVQLLEPLLEVCETSSGARVVLLCTPKRLPLCTALGLGRVARRASRLRELFCLRELGDALGEMIRCS